MWHQLRPVNLWISALRHQLLLVDPWISVHSDTIFFLSVFESLQCDTNFVLSIFESLHCDNFFLSILESLCTATPTSSCESLNLCALRHQLRPVNFWISAVRHQIRPFNLANSPRAGPKSFEVGILTLNWITIQCIEMAKRLQIPRGHGQDRSR